MKILYYDCFCGISGDMNLGALIDLGVDQDYLLAQLALLGLTEEYEFIVRKAGKKGIMGTQVEIRLTVEERKGKGQAEQTKQGTDIFKDRECDDKEIKNKFIHGDLHNNTSNNIHDYIHDNESNNSHNKMHDNKHENIHVSIVNNIANSSHVNCNANKHKNYHGNISEDMHKSSGSKVQARTLKDIEQIITQSQLSPGVKERSLRMFRLLAQAEAKVHGLSIEEIHFHEVGATDAILDLVGAAICLEYLQVDKIIASPVELGGGFVSCVHGILPVPAPAVVELLKGVPVKSGRVQAETTTPTGAVILAANVQEYTSKLNFQINKVGYGLGQRDLEIPNVLRVYLGETWPEEVDSLPEEEDSLFSAREFNQIKLAKTQWLLETNIDDMNPEIFPYVEEKLLALGALDVYKTPIIMKKGRSAVKLSVLAPREKLETLQEAILIETTAIGLRSYPVQKVMLERRVEKVQTPYGVVRVKFSYLKGRLLKYKAEYEDCQRLAKEKGVPLREIYREVELALKRNSEDQ